MNFNKLKSLYDKTPNSIKYILSPLFLRIMIWNPIFRATLREIDEFDKLSEQEKKTAQLIRLKQTICYAYEHVPYYKSLFDSIGFNPESITKFDDLKSLPILEKSTAVVMKDKMYSDEKLSYYKSYTGGSSGQSLTVLLEKDSYYKERAYFCHYLSRFGYDLKKSRLVSFGDTIVKEDFSYSYSPLKNEIIVSPFVLYRRNCFDEIYKVLSEYEGDFMTGYPSAIYRFAQMMKNNNKSLPIKHIVFISENYTNEQKAFIENIFNCKATAYYGHTERAVMAEISDDGCTFKDLYGYTELIPTEQEDEYRIICTGFINRKMPLIRYGTDDVVKITKNGKMKIIGHKTSEIHLVGKGGEEIFKGAFILHLEVMNKAQCYQYVQYEPGKIDLNIVENQRFTDTELIDIQDYLERQTEHVLDVNVNIVDNVILTRRGKFNWAVVKM